MKKDKTRRMVYIPEELYLKAQRYCEDFGLSFSGLVCVALNEYMKQNEVISFFDENKDLKKIVEEAIERAIKKVGEKDED